MKLKFIILALFCILFTSLTIAQNPSSVRREIRSDCNGQNRELTTTDEYNSSQKIVKSIHKNKRKTEFKYDSNGNLIAKIHSDSTGAILRFNKIYYNENNEYSIDTLFSGDSLANMIFKRRHSKKPNEDIITWDNLTQKGSTVIQTLKLDDNKNEIENTICTSSAECTIIKNTFQGNKKIKSEFFRTEEMNRKPVIIETQIFEYDSEGRLSKTTSTNEIDKMCSYILTYRYE